MTKREDLNTVTTITLRVNTDEQPLDGLGELLPRLDELRLGGSYIASVRDLGHSTMRALRVLCLSRCRLADVDGVGELRCLEVLRLDGNRISDASPLESHPALRDLDLSGNRLTEDAIDWLATLPRLARLDVRGNPMAVGESHRGPALAAMPLLVELDGEPTAATGPGSKAGTSGAVGEQPVRPQTSLGFVGPARGPGVASPRGEDEDARSAGSALTYGSDDAMCGSIVAGLRRRRAERKRASSRVQRSETPSSPSGSATSSMGLSLRSMPASPSPPASPTPTPSTSRRPSSPRARRAFLPPATPTSPTPPAQRRPQTAGAGAARGGRAAKPPAAPRRASRVSRPVVSEW